MSAVTAQLPHPATLLAWLDGDIAHDFAGPASSQTAAAGPEATADSTAAAAAAGDVPAEVLAVLMCNGQLAFFRAAESDLWEEALEDQEAAGGPCDALLQLGFSRGTSDTGVATGDSGDIQVPLVEGRRVKGMVWLNEERLLLVAAPFPEEGFESGDGDVLLEVAVQLPPPTFDLTVDQNQQQQPKVSVIATTYAGGAVLKAVAVAAAAGGGLGGVAVAGGALVQLTSGSVLRYTVGGSLTSAGAVANFPCGCPVMVNLPAGAVAAGES